MAEIAESEAVHAALERTASQKAADVAKAVAKRYLAEKKTTAVVGWMAGWKQAEAERCMAVWKQKELQAKAARELLAVTRAVAEAPAGLDLEDMRMTLEEMSLEERVAEWPKQWLQEGMEQGLEQGLQRERALLRRQMTLRFGAGAAEQAAQRLERIADASRLEEVGELIVRCETGGEFLARMGA